MQVHDYTWIFAVSMIAAFGDAFGIGANDVANSFATSVSSGSLSLAQACVIACFTEFLGAVLLGAGTSETIKGGIISVALFVDIPETFMLAMTCAIIGSACWVIFATHMEWPVSSTHSIVGAIIGVGIAGFGGNAVDWSWGGVSKIIASWFISPIIAGCVSAVIYLSVKYTVLRREDSFKWGLRSVPVYFFITTVIEAFYIIYKGAPGTDAAKMSTGTIVGISFAVGTFFAFFAWFFVCNWLKRRIKGHEDLKWYHVFISPFLSKRPTLQQADPELHAPTTTGAVPPQIGEDGNPISEVATTASDSKGAVTEKELAFVQEIPEPKNDFKSKMVSIKDRAIGLALHGVRKDVRNLDNEHLKKVHAAAELYEDDAEYMFSFLQVLTACMASFAHGSNDVSNAVGPVAAVFGVWQTAAVDVGGKVPVPVWILVYGGVAIDLGLATMGYKIMRTMGNNITYFSPSRGFSAELATALTVLTCSKLGLPVSTTHCITGATAAIGLCNGNLSAVNWKMLSWCFASWVITLPCAGLVAGLLFSFAAYAPALVK
ncbi:solute carrier family 20 [Phycomyces blakesleeanus]|uniref:Phosphate transporter n=1 Tax=Phycomyces blakesleeanus TaxID=4837 RepID=A0ABR3AY05_PHYBL